MQSTLRVTTSTGCVRERCLVVLLIISLLLSTWGLPALAANSRVTDENVMIMGEDFSRLTAAAVLTRLQQLDFKVTFMLGSENWTYSFSDLGISVDYPATVRNALFSGRNGSSKGRAGRVQDDNPGAGESQTGTRIRDRQAPGFFPEFAETRLHPGQQKEPKRRLLETQENFPAVTGPTEVPDTGPGPSPGNPPAVTVSEAAGPVNVPLSLVFDEQKLWATLSELSERVNVTARDAAIHFDSQGNATITPSRMGLTVDLDQLVQKIKRELPVCSLIEIPTRDVFPTVTTADLEKIKPVQTIASYTTTLTSDVNRTSNIRIACRQLDGTVVAPGEVFSFNQRIGPRSEANGYRKAMIISGGKFVPGLGGGVCQVSSTLYNTLLDAGLTVTERWQHSLPVPYVPKGRDATVVYGRKDLKFYNNTGAYIVIKASIQGNKLTIGLLGQPVPRPEG